jgi:hypothetical protein
MSANVREMFVTGVFGAKFLVCHRRAITKELGDDVGNHVMDAIFKT